MQYRTLPIVATVDSEKNVCLRVRDLQFAEEPISFDEMSERGWNLVSIVPINADEANWKAVAVFGTQAVGA
jgi:hypothetical protein